MLAQRDLPSWGLPASVRTTRRLFGLLAARHGQQWNAGDIGRVLGLSYHTVNHYLDFLEGALLIRRLPAYSTSPAKQFIKRPKVYWRDSGLLHSLLGISADDNIASLPTADASWEGHVIDRILTALTQTGRYFDAWHLRTTSGREIDLVVRVGREISAIEINLTTNPSRAIMTRLNKTADMIGADRRFVVTRRPGTFGNSVTVACDLDGIITTAAEPPNPNN